MNNDGRLRNHDLLTSLDVLTTGSYRRLPTAIKVRPLPPTRNRELLNCEQKLIIPTPPLTNAEVLQTLLEMEHAMRYRLRMWEVVPVEMRQWRVGESLFAVLCYCFYLGFIILLFFAILPPTLFGWLLFLLVD